MRAAYKYLTWERGSTGEWRSRGEVPAQAKKELSKWPKLPPDGMNEPALDGREFLVKGRWDSHLAGWLSFVF